MKRYGIKILACFKSTISKNYSSSMVLTFKNNKRRAYHFCTDLARDQLHTLNQNLSAIPINESIQKKKHKKSY